MKNVNNDYLKDLLKIGLLFDQKELYLINKYNLEHDLYNDKEFYDLVFNELTGFNRGYYYNQIKSKNKKAWIEYKGFSGFILDIISELCLSNKNHDGKKISTKKRLKYMKKLIKKANKLIKE